MKQLEDEEIGHDIHASGRIAQLREDGTNSFFGPHRERDVHDIDFATAGLLHEFFEVADAAANVGGQFGRAVLRAIVVETCESQAHLRRPLDIPRELNAEFVDAADCVAADVEAVGSQSLLNFAEDDASSDHGGRRGQQPN
jgi:hypothetical protein